MLPARTLVVGVEAGGASKAYPVEALARQNPIVDQVGTTPLLVLLGADGKSVRVFDRRLEGRALELFLKPDTHTLIDKETGTEWDFTGDGHRGRARRPPPHAPATRQGLLVRLEDLSPRHGRLPSGRPLGSLANSRLMS